MKFNNIGLSTSSLKYSLGLELSSNNYNPNPINFTSFLNFTKKLNLSGCEFPFLKFFSENDDIDNILSLLGDYNFFTLINCNKPIDLEQIKYLLPIVKKFKTRFNTHVDSGEFCNTLQETYYFY